MSDKEEIRRLKESATEIVKNSSSLYNCIWRFVNTGYDFSYASFKFSIENASKNMFFTSLFGGMHLDSSGRVIAKNKAAYDDCDEALKSDMLRFYKFEVSFAVKYMISPFLNEILQKYSVTKSEIYLICYYSSLVPKDHINSVVKAIWFGFENDFSTSIHYVASLIETIVRYVLNSKNIVTTNIKDGIEEEKSLNSLLDIKEAKEIFGEDLLFELKAVFTESEGFNLRNDIAHGLVDDNCGDSLGAVYAWWLFLKMIISFDMKLYKISE